MDVLLILACLELEKHLLNHLRESRLNPLNERLKRSRGDLATLCLSHCAAGLPAVRVPGVGVTGSVLSCPISGAVSVRVLPESRTWGAAVQLAPRAVVCRSMVTGNFAALRPPYRGSAFAGRVAIHPGAIVGRPVVCRVRPGVSQAGPRSRAWANAK